MDTRPHVYYTNYCNITKASAYVRQYNLDGLRRFYCCVQCVEKACKIVKAVKGAQQDGEGFADVGCRKQFLLYGSYFEAFANESKTLIK